DYVFFINGIPKFVIEAKNPRENVDRWAFQPQNYAFNLRLYVGMLTNFDEFRLYVVPFRPEKDTPFPAQWSLFFKEYESASQNLWDLLARENVAKGSVEQSLQNLQRVAGRNAKQLWLIRPDRTKTLDNDFLPYLEN